MQKFVIKKSISRQLSRQTSYPRRYSAASARNDESENCGCLCFFLGGVLGPIGLIVAAIIGKVNGVKIALFGWLISWVLVAVIWCGIIALAMRG